MKKKLVQKLMSVALSATMVAGMTACGGATETATPETTTTPETEAVVETTVETEETEAEREVRIDPATGNPYDLGGAEIIIRDWWSPEEPAEPKNAFEEAQLEYREWAQETYNFTIKQVAISDWGSTPEDFLNYATSGGDENYLFVLRPGSELISAMNSGLLYDLSTLDCLDFSQSKWGNKVHELYTKKDAIYAMSANGAEARGGLYFNKRLLEEAGIDPQSIYDLQESGEWTWDKFIELAEKLTYDEDNDGENDHYASTMFASDFFNTVVWSNGGEYIGKENGQYVNKLESENTLEALNWAIEYLDKYDYPQPADTEWDYWVEAFKTGKGAFIAGDAYQAGQEWKEMEDDFGFVCFPKGPKGSDYANCYTDNPYAIPACYDADKAWKIAFAYDVYTEPIPGFEDYNGYIEDYYGKFRDTESVDLTCQRLITNGIVTYHTFIPGLDLGPQLIWGLRGAESPAAAAEAVRDEWAAYLEEANK